MRTVGNALLDGEHVAVVDRDLDLVAGAVWRLRAERDGMPRRQLLAVGGPDRVQRRPLSALRGPAELGEVGARRAERRQEPNRRRILVDRLLVIEQLEVVDLRALEVDRAGELGRLDADSRR